MPPYRPAVALRPMGVSFFNPLFNADLVAIQASLAFNCGEFAIIKSGVEDGLPYAKELHGVPVS